MANNEANEVSLEIAYQIERNGRDTEAMKV